MGKNGNFIHLKWKIQPKTFWIHRTTIICNINIITVFLLVWSDLYFLYRLIYLNDTWRPSRSNSQDCMKQEVRSGCISQCHQVKLLLIMTTATEAWTSHPFTPVVSIKPLLRFWNMNNFFFLPASVTPVCLHMFNTPKTTKKKLKRFLLHLQAFSLESDFTGWHTTEWKCAAVKREEMRPETFQVQPN